MPTLPVFNDSYRPSSNWVEALAQKRAALKQLEPFPSEIETIINRHLLAEFVMHDLALEGLQIDRERILSLIDKNFLETELSQSDLLAKNLLNCFDHLHKIVESYEPKEKFSLSSELLQQLHALLMEGIGDGGGFWRKKDAQPLVEWHQPAYHEALPKLIENALGWFAADSFTELHPVEQAWLVHLRLLDLQPFETECKRLVRLVSNIYTIRAGLGPVVVSFQEREYYDFAVSNAFQMITQPGVELFARSITRLTDELLAIASKSE
ncbi:MAG: Fic family protein [Blastocatellia bacterium]|nr:Fic family protein [Blastocatellia bacterium]